MGYFFDGAILRVIEVPCANATAGKANPVIARKFRREMDSPGKFILGEVMASNVNNGAGHEQSRKFATPLVFQSQWDCGTKPRVALRANLGFVPESFQDSKMAIRRSRQQMRTGCDGSHSLVVALFRAGR